MNHESQHNGDVALFIDWENFKISLAAGHRTPNVSALKEEVANYGRVVVAKAYADWVSRAPELRGASQMTVDPPALYAAGIEPVYVPTRLPMSGAPADSNRTSRVKNSVDVKMTADCIECAHSYENIGTFVLVSGDSDFIHVVNALRTMGKRVIIIGVSWSTSRRLADQVDGLILYDTDVDPVTTPEPVRTNNGRAPTRASSPASPGRPQLAEVIKTIEDIVRTEREAGRTPLLTSLKQRLMRRVPGFDEKKLGFSGFKKLMLRVVQEGNIKLVTVGLVDWIIMADEPDPQESHHETSETSRAAELIDEAEENAHLVPEVEETGVRQAEVVNANGRVGSARSRMANLDQAETPSSPGDFSFVPDDALAGIELPPGPGDGQDNLRVVDLIVMADTLEHREGVSHVAFNFLLQEIAQALEEGLKAEHEVIIRHWGQMHSRTYLTRLLRSLGNGDVFQRGWHTGKDKETGRSRRRSTFNLNRDHSLVKQVLGAQVPEAEPEYDPAQSPAAIIGPGEIGPDTMVSPDEYPELVDPSFEADPESPDTPPEANAPEGTSGISRVMRLFSRS
jgi:uncharacterized LabA/DUF88 family protein